MNAIVFIGIQASGKSTFFQQRFADSHVRINLDMLKTRHREQRLIETCLATEQPFAIDKTNPTCEERAGYISSAHDAGFRVIGYYFQSSIEVCKERNASRIDAAQIPLKGLLGTHAKLELPSYEEGFDELYYVRIDDDGCFVVEEWQA